MEFHLAYSNQIRVKDELRPLQQVRPDRLAIFSTYEEARLYIQMVAAIDRHKFGRDKNGSYFAHAVLFDLPPDEYTQVYGDDNCAGWQLEYYPWHSMFHYPLRFNGQGVREYRNEPPSCGFETTALMEYNESICAGETPLFCSGDLVYLRGWEEQTDTFAVVAGLVFEAGGVRELRSTDIWRGWYYVLVAGPWGCTIECIHTTWECEILPLTCELPEEMRILELFSLHYKGHSLIPEDVLDRLMQGDVSVQNRELFPFHLFDEIDIYS